MGTNLCNDAGNQINLSPCSSLNS